MDPETIPYLGWVFRFGAQDRVLDTILLLGPVVILAMLVVGRHPVTTALVALYVLSFVAYVLYLAARRSRSDRR